MKEDHQPGTADGADLFFHRLQSIGWRLEAQGLSRTLIEPQSNRVKITLRDAREIGSSREVLPQQAVGVLV